MRWMNPILGVVLVAQLAAAVVLATTGGGTGATTSGPLLALADASVDTIVIADGDASVKLVKQDDGWHVAGKSGFPAAEHSVDRLLNDLRSLQTRLPAATSVAARERFQVGKNNFARRITLKDDGNTVATVYFGESAGPGEVYARVAQRNAIYEIRFELWSAKADAGEWLDATYLHRATTELARVELPEITLKHKGNAWQLAQIPGDKTTAVTKTASLVSDLTTLPFETMLGVKQDMNLPEPVFAYTLVTKSGEQVAYRFRKRMNPHEKESSGEKAGGSGKQASGSEKGQRRWAATWLVTTSDSAYVLSIDDNLVRQLRHTSRGKLVLAAGGKDKSGTVDESQMAGSGDGGQSKDKA